MIARRFGLSARRLALIAIAAPLVAACSLDNEVMGSRAAPSGGTTFNSYVALGTSVGAGIQSGGINDSTQKEAYTYRLALAMGLTPGVNWAYPALKMPGCPPPYTNPLTTPATRVGIGAVALTAANKCALRIPGSAASIMNNLSIPSLRAAQVLNVTDLTFANTDTLGLAQFITGSYSPITLLMRAKPTFVTLETFANDVLGAATRGDTLLLTPLASFQATVDQIEDSLDAAGAKVAVFNVPDITVVPHFSKGSVYWCLNNGLCPGVAATLPYSLPSFTVDASCAPNALGGVGDSYLTPFTTTATITATLAAGSTAAINCGAGTATVTPALGSAGAVISPAEYATIRARVAAFNTFLAGEATTRGYALVDLNAVLQAAVTSGAIPPFPSFSTPTALFGPLVSLDGIHPAGAGHRLLAQAAATAINAKFGTAITVP